MLETKRARLVFWRTGMRMAVVLWLFVCTACRPQVPASVEQPATLRIGTALPLAVQTDGVVGILNILARESLVAVSFDGRPVPRLAESVTPLRDGPGVRLRLHPNVRFHNNEPVDAVTVVRLLKTQIAKVKLGSENIAEIIADGSDEILIRYRRPDAFVLTDLNLYNIADDSRLELSTGPFRIVSAQQPVRLAAFDGYYRGRPAIDTVEIREYDTPRAAWTAMMRQEVNFLHEVSRNAVDFVEAESEIKTYPLLRPYYVALVFNMRHPVLGRREVRVALNEGVDRQVVVQQGMWGRGRPADGPIWPYHWAYSSAQRVFAFNPDAARVRLDAAGLAQETDRKRGRMLSRLRFRCLVPSDDSRFERIALVLQRQLADIGVDLEFEPVPVRGMLARVISGDFDAFLYEMTSGRTLSWVYRFWHSPSPNALTVFSSGYSSADEPLDRIRSSQSEADTRIAVADLQRTLYEDPPAVFIAWPQETRAIDTTFTVPYERDTDVLGAVWRGRLTEPNARAAR